MLSKFDSVIAAAKQMSEVSSENVGAALLCKDGSIYSAAEFKFKSGSCIIAEMSALAKALEDKKTKFTALAVFGKSQIEKESQSTLMPLGDMWVVFANNNLPNKNTTLFKL